MSGARARGEGAPSARGPVVLALEASTPEASVAVLRGGAVLAEAAAVMRPGAADALMPAVDAALGRAGARPSELAAVACGAGPGGFTSLRIAAAIAKGIAHATGRALVAVPSLALAAAARAARAADDGRGAWLVSLDALRGERYAARITTARMAGRVVVTDYTYLGVLAAPALTAEQAAHGGLVHVDANAEAPRAAGVGAFALRGVWEETGEPGGALAVLPVDLDAWEPDYGRQAEAQARWELAHGRALATTLVSETDGGPAGRDAGAH